MSVYVHLADIKRFLARTTMSLNSCGRAAPRARKSECVRVGGHVPESL